MAKIAFDIDDTLYKIVKSSFKECDSCVAKPGSPYLCSDCLERRDKVEETFTQVPDYDLLQVLRWFVNNGDEVFIWSAGGLWYVEKFIKDFGLEGVKPFAKMHVDKDGMGTGMPVMDIAFDDCEVNLGKVTILVKRDKR